VQRATFCLLFAAGLASCSRGAPSWYDPDAAVMPDSGARDLQRPDLAADPACPTPLPSTEILFQGRGAISLPRILWNGVRYALLWQETAGTQTGIQFALAGADGKLDAPSIRRLGAGAQNLAARIAYSGKEYAVVYASGAAGARQARFVRLSAAGEPIASSDILLGSMASGLGLGLAWNPATSEWAVAWEYSQTTAPVGYRIYLARIASANPSRVIGTPTLINEGTSRSTVAETGTPLIWTGTRYALVFISGTAVGPQLAEFSETGQLLRRISFGTVRNGLRPTVAWHGAGYAVAWLDNRTSPAAVRFARIDPGGSYIAASERALGTSGTYQAEPSLSWTGSEHVVVWYQAPANMTQEGLLWGVRLGPNGEVVQPAQAIASTYGLWPDQSWNGCQQALIYLRKETGSAGLLRSKGVLPGP
jgi:hypothetical protein